MNLTEIESDGIERGLSPFFDDLTPPPTSRWFGYEVKLPSVSELAELSWQWVSWAFAEASRFGELGEQITLIRGEVSSSGEVVTGVVGEREINRKVRVTAINGIQNTLDAAVRGWEKIAKLFGTKIHFVYNETKGSAATDGAHAVWDKYVLEKPKTVQALADHWESLLNEIGDDGLIYHIAHSHGALLTTLAADIVSPQVRSRLVIRTFGAFQSPHHKDFADLKNVICPEDPIVWFNSYEDDGSIVRVPGMVTTPSFFTNPAAYVHENHSLTTGPYWRYLEEYESYDFRAKYETYSSKFSKWIGSFWGTSQAPETERPQEP